MLNCWLNPEDAKRTPPIAALHFLTVEISL
jgi:hypothetical protein